MNATYHVEQIQAAEVAVNDARESQSGKDFPNETHGLHRTFWIAFEELLFAIRAAVEYAEDESDGWLMRELVPTLASLPELIKLSKETSVWPFCRRLTMVHESIQRLRTDNLPPKIESPLQMQASHHRPAQDPRYIEGTGWIGGNEADDPTRWIAAIHSAWPHVSWNDLRLILAGRLPDLDPATHPDYAKWAAEQNELPDVYESADLQGECRRIETQRKRHGRPVQCA